eukprot:m.159342 g.159342  ORF g.159342 m.159342 type:complete len:221 (+) comp11778_c0_seq1:83-745(+)
MSTKLYTFPGSANSSCARAVLMAGDVAFEEVNPVGYSDGPGGTRSTEYLAKFCNGQAPALEHGDVTVCENGAIARYAAAVFPKLAQYYGPDAVARAKIDSVYDYIATSVYGEIAKVSYPVFGWMPAPDAEADKAAKAQLTTTLESRFVNLLLKDNKFLCGDTPTLADFRFGPILHFASVAVPLSERLTTYMADLAAAIPNYSEAVAGTATLCADKGINAK